MHTYRYPLFESGTETGLRILPFSKDEILQPYGTAQ